MSSPTYLHPQQAANHARHTLTTPPTNMSDTMGASGTATTIQQSHSRPSSAASSAPMVNPFQYYRSLGIIGRGKYSEVHKAELIATGEQVAMKKVQIFEMDSDGRKECINEANILQALPTHPHIIQYKHSYLYENDLYLILELAESGDISLLLEQQRKKGSYFQEVEIWHYFVQIADALNVMHQCRVMHRDIKPANVFLTTAAKTIPNSSSSTAAATSTTASPLNAGLTIKLGDLGLGRYLSSKTYETFSMVGTPFYMSPEAIANTGYDFKSDIWSAGCLLYEMTALKSPFYSTSLNFYTLGNAITKAQYAPPPGHFSSTLRNLLTWMIQPLPDDRPDISQVLKVAQMACQSILRTGNVSDDILVGAAQKAAAAQQQQQLQQQSATSSSITNGQAPPTSGDTAMSE